MPAEDIVIMAQEEIQVYVNENCAITIRQVCPHEEDQIIQITVGNIDDLIVALQRTKKEAMEITEAGPQ